MKKIQAWLLLLTYLCVNLTGVLPLVNDLLAHTFWHEHHIQHAHHGDHHHHHVEKEIAAIFKTSDQKAHLTERSSDKQVSVHFPFEILRNQKSDQYTYQKGFSVPVSLFPDLALEILSPPPRLV